MPIRYNAAIRYDEPVAYDGAVYYGSRLTITERRTGAAQNVVQTDLPTDVDATIGQIECTGAAQTVQESETRTVRETDADR